MRYCHPTCWRPEGGRLALAALFAVLLAACASEVRPAVSPSGAETTAAGPVPYEWNRVTIVGGGYVTGVAFHPAEAGLRYARTDIGGAYRWNDEEGEWAALLDALPPDEANWLGIESLALDPSDPERLYLAAGTYLDDEVSDGVIFRSNDRGRTFERTPMPFKMGGNELGRANGERLSVDPNDGRVLYFGTRQNGLWRSTDRAQTWQRVDGFPEGLGQPAEASWDEDGTPIGVVFVRFDARSGAGGQPTQTLYAGVSTRDTSLWRSTDGGQTWRAVPGQPTGLRPTQATLATDGTFYVAYGREPGPNTMTDGAVWKLDTDRVGSAGAWTGITPHAPAPEAGDPFGYPAVAVAPGAPQTVLVTTHGRGEGTADTENEVFRSTDGGRTWTGLLEGATWDHARAPYTENSDPHWMDDVEIDPFDPGHVLFTTGYGLWETSDATDKPVHWRVGAVGIEETVPLSMVSPSGGVHLISGIGDYGGFAHRDFSRSPRQGEFRNPPFRNTHVLDYAEQRPEVVVRLGLAGWGTPDGPRTGLSTDGGFSWRPFPEPEGSEGMRSLAVSAGGETLVGTVAEGVPGTYVSPDWGAAWHAVEGLPPDGEVRVLADRVNADHFYAFGKRSVFRSTDGGRSFERVAHDVPFETAREVNAVFSRAGHLWVGAEAGLFRSVDAGATWQHVHGPRDVRAFGFGRALPEASYPALYVAGRHAGARAVFRSADAGATWRRINDDAHRWGKIYEVTGDPRVSGRVYVGIHGRGIQYGMAARR